MADEGEPTGLPEGIEDDGAAGVETQLLRLTDEERRAYLGRLAEFEVKLSALPEKKANFVLAVLNDPTDFVEAARLAGYKAAGASQSARSLLMQPQVAALIALGEQIREDRTFLTKERTLHEYSIIAFSDITNYTVKRGELTVKDGVPEYATRAISSMEVEETTWVGDDGHERTTVKTKVRLWSKTEALKMLATYQMILSKMGTDTTNIDKSRHVHIHQHQHNTWQVGDKKLTF